MHAFDDEVIELLDQLPSVPPLHGPEHQSLSIDPIQMGKGAYPKTCSPRGVSAQYRISEWWLLKK